MIRELLSIFVFCLIWVPCVYLVDHYVVSVSWAMVWGYVAGSVARTVAYWKG